jgi:NAD(P)-dependent dehydrogenase (short-subunit alcohol dehydrogenase family)
MERAMKRLQSKVAVITGACSGIGLATTELFLSEGAQVVAADVQDEVGQQLQVKYPGQLYFAHCDVTQLDELRAAIDSAAAHFGGLDILFSNAGRIGTMGGVQAFNAQAWDDTQNLLLRSVAAGASYAVPHMVKRGGGAIVNTSSISALQAGYAPLAYSVAKAGVLHYTQVAAAELCALNIRINAVVPGFIATRIFGGLFGMDPEASQELAHRVSEHSSSANPIGRAGHPQDIAEAALYLASDAARFVTGTHITVDGGITIGPRHSWDPQTTSPMSQALGVSREQIEAMRKSAHS